MNRLYPYRIDLWMYSGHRETHYIKAKNHADAFSKAHHFAVPIAMSGKYGGVQFINDTKLTKQYCIDHHISFEEV